ncbi:hypothetical protein PgNI_06364 [Pyricularia grisea]|uniref:Uncharacterized protein n=1 Tax=Pyricularia grisea TaxID=148305 RepID=A0A6P8B499_PYRGI|nr:hypothetical protein PgNI_06364 [Pyricularia grisea]TLD10122.1 hypothetical protein PgNI_06364 [Pyricularia grisea]
MDTTAVVQPTPDSLTPPSRRKSQPHTGQANSHATSQSLYQCAYCLRRYSRPEHLQRHIATHTLGKRFVCDICEKAFGRGDLLKRHRQNHQDDPTGAKKRRVTSTAGRVTAACQACARARVKCDEIKPCARCKNRNQKCEYSTSEASSAAAMHLLHLSAARSSSGSPDGHDHKSSTKSVSNSPSPLQTHQVIDAASFGQQTPISVTNAFLQPQFTLPVQPPLDPRLAGMDSANGSGVIGHPAAGFESMSRTPDGDVAMDATCDRQYQGATFTTTPYRPLTSGSPPDAAPFAYFMRDVLYDELDPSRMVGAQGLSVLDFNANSSMELNDVDLGLLDQWSGHAIPRPDATQQPPTGTATKAAADLSKMRKRLVKSWSNSPWRWNPTTQDSGYCEQENLTVPQADSLLNQVERIISDKLDPSIRDRILASVLSECRGNDTLRRVASSFPSTEILESLSNIFVASHMSSVSSWLHLPTLKLNNSHPELIACFASSGAAICPNMTLRRFGQALQEVVRLTLPARFEESHVRINDIGLVQSLVLMQDLGLWSGNRRKMEIAECHLNIPITMMRYRNKFKRSYYSRIVVTPEDQGEVLEQKWKHWREQESWKRLVFHCHLRDAQKSLTTLTPPQVSYAELTLPLPEPKQLWFASTAKEWQTQYLARGEPGNNVLPSLVTLFQDMGALGRDRHRVDIQYATAIYLHGVWSLIWELRQLAAVQRHSIFSRVSASTAPGSQIGAQDPASLLLKSRHHEICKMLEDFSSATSDWNELSAQEILTLNLLQLHLHVSMDELQILSGRENEEQARRVFIHLQTWAESEEARRAIWHAGQVLRMAKLFPTGHLKDFYAIGVHHAALTIWTYGVIKNAAGPGNLSGLSLGDLVYLDGPQASQVTQFINFGQGCPAIRGPTRSVVGNSGNLRQDDERQQQQQKYGGSGVVVAPVSDSQACMTIALDIFHSDKSGSAHEDEEQMVSINENLCHLLAQLRSAARAVADV